MPKAMATRNTLRRFSSWKKLPVDSSGIAALGASAEAESYHLGGFLSQFLCVAKACGQGPRFSYSSRVITQGFDFIAVMFGICGVLVAIEQRSRAPFFRWFPSIVLVMFASMALYTAGLWEMTDEIRLARTTVRDNLIPAMLFLMSLRFNLVVIRKLGARLIALCLASTLSIMIGFVVVHELMSPFLGDETPLTFATMSAGWTGGTQNFVAVKEALSVTDAAMTYTLLMGALCYSVWLVIIIAMKPFKEKFAGFLRADDSGLNDILNSLAGSGLLNPMIWTIIISSALGMLAAPTWLGRTAGSDEVSGVMLYVIVALIGAEVSLSAIVQAPMYILSGFMILTIHVTILLFIARMLRMNLHLTAIASIANIGSAPSAAVVGAAYGRHLVPVAIIMALIGSMVGSFVGLGVAEILSWFAVK
jgi:uncharacterized membrane protein